MKLVRQLMLAQGRRCFWCDAWLITEPYHRYVKGCFRVTPFEVTWMEDGVVMRAKVASIDQLVPQWLLGQKSPSKLCSVQFGSRNITQPGLRGL